MLNKWAVTVVFLFVSVNVRAQTASVSSGGNAPQASLVRADEIKAGAERNNANAVVDTVLRMVSIEAKYNVGVSVVRRSQVDGKTPPDAIVHDAITEVYQITEGSGVFVTGGTIEDATPLAADSAVVRQLAGPSSNGKRILGGTRQAVGPGDVLIIPPHTPHGFAEIKTPRIVYTLIRIDPQRLLELKGPPR